MNLVDSSGWLAYFADEPGAEHFQEPLHDPASLIIPTVVIFEVYKVILRESSEHNALQAASVMQKGTILDLTPQLAIAAAKVGLQHRIPMADSIIYAAAHLYKALVWTQDADFENLPGVKYFPRLVT